MNTLKCLNLCVAFGAVALAVPAQPAGEQGPDAPRRPGPPVEAGRGQRMMQVQPRPGGVPIEAVLTPEQRMEFRDEISPHREKLRELEERQATLRREFEEALFADKLDEKVVREKSTAMAEVEAERSLIRARAFAKIRPSLTEEQLERLKTMRAEAGRAQRMGPDGGFRRFQEGGPGPDDRLDRPRRPRPPEEEGERDVLPPPAPPRPPAPPAPAPK